MVTGVLSFVFSSQTALKNMNDIHDESWLKLHNGKGKLLVRVPLLLFWRHYRVY